MSGLAGPWGGTGRPGRIAGPRAGVGWRWVGFNWIVLGGPSADFGLGFGFTLFLSLFYFYFKTNQTHLNSNSDLNSKHTHSNKNYAPA